MPNKPYSEADIDLINILKGQQKPATKPKLGPIPFKPNSMNNPLAGASAANEIFDPGATKPGAKTKVRIPGV